MVEAMQNAECRNGISTPAQNPVYVPESTPRYVCRRYASDGTKSTVRWSFTPLSFGGSGFDGEIAGRGQQRRSARDGRYRKERQHRTRRENELYTTFQLVNEAMARRINSCRSIFINRTRVFPAGKRSDTYAFNSLPGLGDAAAKAIAETAKANPELSKEELRQKAQISKSVMEILERNGVLKNMSETNQITLF